MAAGLVGSEILRIAADIRALIRGGRKICNLTVGDFDPKQFPIPARLKQEIGRALERGETNYPPSDGVLELRQAVQRYYRRELGLTYPLESFLICGGARPAIYGTYRTLVDPGDRVVYPLPSWNNNHYIHQLGAAGVPVPCTPEHRFLPTLADLKKHLGTARLICLNSPLNPSGTAFDRESLKAICEGVLAENRRREEKGARPLFLMYDQVYWPLCVGETKHVTPPELIPEMARYTVFVDGISKAFAATGVRVGWAVGPVDVIERMSAILGHVGAWAPRAEQVATVALLDDPAACAGFHTEFIAAIQRRLDRLHQGFQGMKSKGLPVESIPPMGAIYLTVRIHPFGRRTPAGGTLKTNEDVRKYVLDTAQIGIVAFQAFGVPEDSGWFRLSVGAVSEDDIAAALPRLEQALAALA
ncbi:MAG: aminotransferase class I/II-fold pyridoxal phosphate-dependent enzyme [Planctomycetes bacterium]|nr:aminotransferase class I/II-fold pyridoxal phosphate-dependent enzyme [Planctomycetota bacterium]